MVAWWVQFERSVEDHSSEPEHPVEVTIVLRMRGRLMMKWNGSLWQRHDEGAGGAGHCRFRQGEEEKNNGCLVGLSRGLQWRRRDLRR